MALRVLRQFHFTPAGALFINLNVLLAKESLFHTMYNAMPVAVSHESWLLKKKRHILVGLLI